MFFSEKFIIANKNLCDFDNFVPAPYFRKEFELDFLPQKAEITICGLGFYELYVNGVDITKGFLAPYINNPNHFCYYDNYDVSKYLTVGKNVIAVLLGNGMRNAFGGFVWNFDKATFRGPLTLALSFEAFSEEKQLKFEADESFLTAPSPIIFNDIRMGCRYDARKEIVGWNEVNFDSSTWAHALFFEKPKGEPVLCNVEPIVLREKLKPVSIKFFEKTPYAFESTDSDALPVSSSIIKNAYLYDFGVNTAGISVLKIKGREGQKITIRHAENLQNGFFSVNSTLFNNPGWVEKYREFGQTNVYICSGKGEEIFVPKFSYEGFRYVLVEGVDADQADSDLITYYVLSSDIKSRTDFTCSDNRLNKLFEFTKRSDLSNFYYFPTDCPHREKNGWTGDTSMSAEQLLLNFCSEKSLFEWYKNAMKAQTIDGNFPGIVPTAEWAWGYTVGPIWDTFCVNIPYYIYKFTGNKKYLEESFASIFKYLEYISKQTNDDGLYDFGLGDWVDPNFIEKGKISSPNILTASIAVYDIVCKAEFIFSQINKTNELLFAEEFADKLKTNIRGKLIDFPSCKVVGDCQTSQVLAIAFDLFNKDELKIAEKYLLDIIRRDGFVNSCGMYGLRYIYHVLCNTDNYNMAYDLIVSEDRHCYGSWIKNGATSLWENFPLENGRGLASQNHHFLGDISSIFIQEFAGIKPNPENKDVNRFEISPKFVKTLNFVDATFNLPQGDVRCKWERINKKIKVVVRIPSGIYGKLILKSDEFSTDKSFDLNEGEYSYIIE